MNRETVKYKELIKNEYNNVITSYWFWADQLLMANQIENGELWLVNNFININYAPCWFPGAVYFINNDYRNKMVEFYDCPYLCMQKIFFDDKKKIAGKDILTVILENISNGRFVMIMADRFFLNRGQHRGNEHELLIHGYDLEKEQIFYADNSDNGKFSTNLKCSFEEVRKGFYEARIDDREPDFDNSIFTFSINHENGYQLNIKKIIHQLQQYIKEEQICFSGVYRNGIGVYKCLSSFLYENSRNPDVIGDIRGICVIRDHKRGMIQRIRYLEKCFQVGFEALNLFMELEKNCDMAVMLYLKYRFTKKQETIIKVSKILLDIEKKERNAIVKLISELARFQEGDIIYG